MVFLRYLFVYSYFNLFMVNVHRLYIYAYARHVHAPISRNI